MQHLHELAKAHLSFLCEKITNRCVGSKGNLSATNFFSEQLENYNWQVERQAFEAFDWESEYACIEIGELVLKAFSSPYSNSCNLKTEVEIVSTIEELKKTDTVDKILIVKGELSIEQLMPKNFVFYNPDHHKNILASLENSRALAFIFIVGKSGFYEGGEYPFPIIEDGDFMIPSVFISEEDGEQLLMHKPKMLKLISRTKKIPSKGYNVIGRQGHGNGKRITITAHIDAKKGSSGAIDNGTGVVTMLLLSELLKDYIGNYQIELVALNGEDYYSVPGQMTYLKNNKDNFSDIALNINIDGAGLNIGKTAYALINLPDVQINKARDVFKQFSGFVEGKPWLQGDHSMFLQFGVPAIAISSEWLLDNLQTQRITHTENDTMSRVDLDKVIELANAICTLIYKL
ncbi:M28 family peptidase [Fulvivirga sp. M361]|uniref:M28 family peptidase n=1 Tax=Fulvivirga sp. M361 TaxID=2594266 RepID=UPI00117B419E|nr:M28 family peptidase [Fulvivirga sp. M361]TRX59980.1 M28 family peptidase [Fulvivirga sp. M361]